jgi:hypothetical protein
MGPQNNITSHTEIFKKFFKPTLNYFEIAKALNYHFLLFQNCLTIHSIGLKQKLSFSYFYENFVQFSFSFREKSLL